MKNIYGKMISFLMGILCGSVLLIPIGWIFGIESATTTCFEVMFADALILVIVIVIGSLRKDDICG